MNGGEASFVPRGSLTASAVRELPRTAEVATPAWDDVVVGLFGLEEVAGRVEASPASSGWGEVWTDGPAGRVGVVVGPSRRAPGWGARLEGLSHDEARRTNLWIGSVETASVRLRVFDAESRELTRTNVTIPAGGQFFSNVLEMLGVPILTDGSLEVWSNDGHPHFDVWASVVDRATLDARIVTD